MTFDQWSDNLEFRSSQPAEEVLFPLDFHKPWRCDGPCGRLMYGIEREEGKNYPSPKGTPAGLFLNKDHDRVCQVCWEMHHAFEKSATGYWQGIQAGEKKKFNGLKGGGDYLYS